MSREQLFACMGLFYGEVFYPSGDDLLPLSCCLASRLVHLHAQGSRSW